MLKNKILIIFLLSLFISKSQEVKDLSFLMKESMFSNDLESDLIVTPDGGRLLVLELSDSIGVPTFINDLNVPDPADKGLLILKYDSLNQLEWRINYNTEMQLPSGLTIFEREKHLESVFLDGNSNIVIQGYQMTYGFDRLYYPMTVVLTLKGNVLFESFYNVDEFIRGTEFSGSHNVNGSVLAGDIFYGISSGLPDSNVIELYQQGFVSGLIKRDSLGETKWGRNLNLLSSKVVINGSVIDNKENVYVVGEFEDTLVFKSLTGIDTLIQFSHSYNSGYRTRFLIKYDQNGTPIWAKRFSAISNFKSRKVKLKVNSENQLIIAGNTLSKVDMDPGVGVFTFNAFSYPTTEFISVISEDGDLIWLQELGGARIFDLDFNSNDEVVAVGSFNYTFQLSSDPKIRYYNSKTTTYGGFASVFSKNGVLLDAFAIDNIHGGYAPTILNVKFRNDKNIDFFTYFDDHIFIPYAGGLKKLESDNSGLAMMATLELKDSLCQRKFPVFEYQDVRCDTKGFINFNYINGQQPVIYSFNNSNYSLYDSLFVDSLGVYDVIISDASGCDQPISVVVGGKSGDLIDLGISELFSEFRPGFSNSSKLILNNFGCKNPKNVTVELSLDSLIEFESSNLTPFSVTDSLIVWKFPGDSMTSHIEVDIKTNQDAVIGEFVHLNYSIYSDSIDVDSSDNYKSYYAPIVNGYDPNDISVTPKGVCDEFFVKKDTSLKFTYKIRFQNTGNSKAIGVRLENKIDDNLNIKTLRVIGKSHDSLKVVIDSARRVNFYFDDINLPSKALNEEESKGYVIYEICSHKELKDSLMITNDASIFFDFNPPINTNVVKNTLISEIPPCTVSNLIYDFDIIRFYPNPSNGVINVFDINEYNNVNIYNSLGQRVDFSMEANRLQITNPIPGIYLLQIKYQNKLLFGKVVIR